MLLAYEVAFLRADLYSVGTEAVSLLCADELEASDEVVEAAVSLVAVVTVCCEEAD